MKQTIIAFLAFSATSCQPSDKASKAEPIVATACCEAEGTCSGTNSCSACKNCNYCKHCSKDGGSCGKCN